MTITPLRALFYLSAAYDGAIGLVFIFAPSFIFHFFEVAPPNHWAYVQFPAALLLIFAMMFLGLARKPVQNKDLLPYCILLKIAYCGVSGAYWGMGQLPAMWQPFFICDFVMLIAYIWAYSQLSKMAAQPEQP